MTNDNSECDCIIGYNLIDGSALYKSHVEHILVSMLFDSKVFYLFHKCPKCGNYIDWDETKIQTSH